MKTIVGAAIGNCVHVAGLNHFLKLAETEGYHTISLGPAVSPERLVNFLLNKKPDIVAISYRLTPQVAVSLFKDLKHKVSEAGLKNLRFIFGGTPPVAEVAKDSGFFEKVFSGKESIEDIRAYLQKRDGKTPEQTYAQNLIERIGQKYPYPLLRHHFGRPTMEETIKGVKIIAEAGILDVISIGPDQNAQEHFFHPEEMDHSQDGAGGVPLRKPDDLMAIYDNSRYGNYPLVRCYAGTRDLIRWAEMSVRTINNAWGAIPICWYSRIDGRSSRTIEEAIREHQETIKWYADRNIPVEVNESHQWSLRDAHDTMAVTMAFLAAYNAKKMGVRNYISQLMFNTPPGTSAKMDIAKMLAKKELIEELEDESFTIYREVRAGLSHFSSNPFVAQGQLAASAVIGLALNPHILHVVGFSEGDHAIYPEELLQSCGIIHGVLHNCLHGMPDMTIDTAITKRKNELKSDSRILLDALHNFGKKRSDDPWADPSVISLAIQKGLLDAPHFRGNPHLCGKILTHLIDGAWYAIDEVSGNAISEHERVKPFIQD